MNVKYKFGLSVKTNLINISDPNNSLGHGLNQYGDIVEQSGFNTTAYIDLLGSIEIVISQYSELCFYDSEKIFISSDVNPNGGVNTRFIIPNNARYVRFYVAVSSWNSDLLMYSYNLVRPNYKDDLTLDYDMESSQRFYRSSLSGKLTFLRDDSTYINNQLFESIFYINIYKSNDNGVSYQLYHEDKFMKTDCTFNIDDNTVTVKPEQLDQYIDVLAGLEKEYNLIKLKPEIDSLLIKKRPLIQTYLPGDSTVSCFLGGTNWEEDANAVTDENALVSTYHFALNTKVKEAYVTSTVYVGVDEVYTGQITYDGNLFDGYLYPGISNGYRLHMKRFVDIGGTYNTRVELVKISDNTTYLIYGQSSWTLDEIDNVVLSSPNGIADIKTYKIYARYLVDVDKIGDLTTYDLPIDDIVSDNRNYKKAIGYAVPIGYITGRYSVDPTEYGRTFNDKYYDEPYSTYGQKFYPIARTTWRYASLWFAFHYLDQDLEKDARKTYILRDAYPIASVINVLLNEVAPGIIHEATPEYSQFLYSSSNPITGDIFRLYVTQKTNILTSPYQKPAEKAQTTLRDFLNMLKNCYQLYWYIEDNKFKIEHILWFKNGGSYNSNEQVIGYDITILQNIRNNKKFGYANSEYTFDKADMAERYQFKWMDDVTAIFEGDPIEVLSKYVQAGKVEDTTISGFNSDVDLMLLNPGAMNNDGFAIFAGVPANALSNDDSGEVFGASSGTDGYTTPKYGIRPELQGKNGVLQIIPNGGGTGSVVFYDVNNNIVSTQGNFTADNNYKQINVNIPVNAVNMAYIAVGTISVKTLMLRVDSLYELPIIERVVDGVGYQLQNGYLSMTDLLYKYWRYDLPAKHVKMNGVDTIALELQRKKKQSITIPTGNDDPDPLKLVKTTIGNGEIDKISVNLCSRTSKITLKYDTE